MHAGHVGERLVISRVPCGGGGNNACIYAQTLIHHAIYGQGMPLLLLLIACDPYTFLKLRLGGFV